MNKRLRNNLLLGWSFLLGLTACQPDYITVQPVTSTVQEPTISYRIRRKIATGNCYTNKSTEYEYVKDQTVSKAIVTGLDRGAGPPFTVYTYDANGRVTTNTDYLPTPAMDNVSGYVTSYRYTGNSADVRTDVIRSGRIDNTNYNLSRFNYNIVDGVTLSAVEEYKEQDGRPMKAYHKYTYADGNLTRYSITINSSSTPASDFTYTYDDKPNPFKGRGLPEPSYLNGRNNVLSVTSKYSHIANAFVEPVKYTYNEKGYPITSLDSRGCSTQFEYETY